MKKLAFVTCSGVNENIDPYALISLAQQYPVVEYGIQVSGKKCSKDTGRYHWIKQLRTSLERRGTCLNLALHINQDWVESFCCQEELPEELEYLLHMVNAAGRPLFQRVQLNFKVGRDKTPDMELLQSHMWMHGLDRRFILSYNAENESIIRKLYAQKERDFDVLFDSSHGEGITATQWQKPVFDDSSVLQGYAGGLSPENVGEILRQISEVVPENGLFYIDAEGKLKGEKGYISLEKCRQYIENALTWETEQEQ